MLEGFYYRIFDKTIFVDIIDKIKLKKQNDPKKLVVLFVLAILMGILASIIYFLKIDILPFVNSNFIVGIFTFLTGLIAISIYLLQKRDKKRNTAKTLYYEIIATEKIISDMQDIKSTKGTIHIDPNKYHLGISTWTDSKYAFINDLSTHEWEKLNNFYNLYDALNHALQDIQSIMNQNIVPRSATMQHELGKLAIEYIKQLYEIGKGNSSQDSKNKKIEELNTEYEKKTSLFKNGYIDNPMFQYQYYPTGYFTFLDSSLLLIETNLSTSTIGQKLKKIANVN